MTKGMKIYLSVDYDGEENIFEDKPELCIRWIDGQKCCYWVQTVPDGRVRVPNGTIAKILGREVEPCVERWFGGLV